MARVLLNIELLKAFVEVAEQRSFTRAAVTLCRTQSAVSMQIKRLEGSLGEQLFQRDAQRIELSAAGHAMLTHARRMLELNDEAVAQVSGASSEPALRIGVMEDYGASALQPALARLGADVPRARIQVSTGLTSLMLKQLGSDFDLVIAFHPQGHEDGILLSAEQPVWAAGAGWRLDAGRPISLALYRPACLLRTWGTQALDRSGWSWHLSFVGESAQAVQAVAAAGRMLTVVKSSMFPRQLLPVTARLGLPSLPAAEVRLHRAAHLSRSGSLFADRLTGLLQASFQS